jgi:hypothetical protein
VRRESAAFVEIGMRREVREPEEERASGNSNSVAPQKC